MSDTKELTWGDAARSEFPGDEESTDETSGNGDQPNEEWDACRNWLSRAPAPVSQRRQTIDPSVYTWKGYRSWSDRVKRSWTDRKENDND